MSFSSLAKFLAAAIPAGKFAAYEIYDRRFVSICNHKMLNEQNKYSLINHIFIAISN
jgi:hypothetical protein